MSGRTRRAAVSLALLVVLLALWRLNLLAPIGLPWLGAAPASDGAAVPGARGRLAFIREGDVWTYDLQKGVAQRLTRDGGARAPHWSAAGGWLSFQRTGRLWLIKVDGSGAYAAPGGDVPASARWSPRGVRLAYTSADGSLSILEPSLGEKGRRVVVPAGSGAGPGVVWESDATRVLYERHLPVSPTISNEGIWSVTVTGKDPIPVYAASGNYLLNVCCWTTAGNYVFFWQGTLASSGGAGLPLFVSRAGSSQPVLVSPAAPVRREWSDTAARADAIAFVAGDAPEATAGKSLVAVQPEATSSGAISVRTVALEDSPALAPLSPAWAPQNASVAYSTGPSLVSRGGDLPASLAGRRIWLVQPNGSNKRPLLPEATVPAAVSDERPHWARDGKTVYFARRLQPQAAAEGATGAGMELWAALADGSQARRVVGGLADPGLGESGVVAWDDLFDYYPG